MIAKNKPVSSRQMHDFSRNYKKDHPLDFDFGIPEMQLDRPPPLLELQQVETASCSIPSPTLKDRLLVDDLRTSSAPRASLEFVLATSRNNLKHFLPHLLLTSLASCYVASLAHFNFFKPLAAVALLALLAVNRSSPSSSHMPSALSITVQFVTLSLCLPLSLSLIQLLISMECLAFLLLQINLASFLLLAYQVNASPKDWSSKEEILIALAGIAFASLVLLLLVTRNVWSVACCSAVAFMIVLLIRNSIQATAASWESPIQFSYGISLIYGNIFTAFADLARSASNLFGASSRGV